MSAIPALKDDNANNHGGHQSNTGESQGHVNGAAFLGQFHSANREALQNACY